MLCTLSINLETRFTEVPIHVVFYLVKLATIEGQEELDRYIHELGSRAFDCCAALADAVLAGHMDFYHLKLVVAPDRKACVFDVGELQFLHDLLLRIFGPV